MTRNELKVQISGEWGSQAKEAADVKALKLRQLYH